MRLSFPCCYYFWLYADLPEALYGNSKLDQLKVVGKIQSVIQELHDIGRSFPQSLLLDFSQPLQNVTRTGSSLYLMLLQVRHTFESPTLLLSDECFKLLGYYSMHSTYATVQGADSGPGQTATTPYRISLRELSTTLQYMP